MVFPAPQPFWTRITAFGMQSIHVQMTKPIQAQDHLETLFLLDGRKRIFSTREPDPSPGPSFILVRRAESVAWAVNSSLAEELAREVEALALDERPTSDYYEAPKHLDKYLELLSGNPQSAVAFEFPALLEVPSGVAQITDFKLLQHSFSGWTAEEIPHRWPIMAVLEDEVPVSVCFSSRLSEVAAEAGVETTPQSRGRGYAGIVTGAWAAAISESGRTPIYSLLQTNKASIAVARKLGLVSCASYWSTYTT
jgi:hypothetical protein